MKNFAKSIGLVLVAVFAIGAVAQSKLIVSELKIEPLVSETKDGSPLNWTMSFKSDSEPKLISGTFTGPDGAEFFISGSKIEKVSRSYYRAQISHTLPAVFYSGNFVLQALQIYDGVNRLFTEESLSVVAKVRNSNSNGVHPEKPSYTVSQTKLPNGDTIVRLKFSIWSGTTVKSIFGTLRCQNIFDGFSTDELTKGRQRPGSIIAEYRGEDSLTIKKDEGMRGKCSLYEFHAIGENGLRSKSPDDRSIVIK